MTGHLPKVWSKSVVGTRTTTNFTRVWNRNLFCQSLGLLGPGAERSKTEIRRHRRDQRLLEGSRLQAPRPEMNNGIYSVAQYDPVGRGGPHVTRYPLWGTPGTRTDHSPKRRVSRGEVRDGQTPSESESHTKVS